MRTRGSTGRWKATETPSWEVLGHVNEHAYATSDVFVPLIRGLRDARFTPHGIRRDGTFVCVALTLVQGDDACLHYVATEPSHQRQGLATHLLRSMLTGARAQGLRTATLQATPEGMGVYESLGFRRVGAMRAYLRDDVAQ